MATPDELLEHVVDRASFITFTEALKAERNEAEKLERADPEKFKYDGAMGWRNGDISGFLDAGLECLYHAPQNAAPTWRMFADFLYWGKGYE